MTRRRISQVIHFIPLVEVGLPFPSLLSSSLTPAQPPKPRKNKQVSSVQRRRLKQSKSALIGFFSLLSPTQTHPRSKQTRSDYQQYVRVCPSLPLFCYLPSPTSHTHTHAHACTRMHLHAHAHTHTHTHTHVHTHTHTSVVLVNYNFN